MKKDQLREVNSSPVKILLVLTCTLALLSPLIRSMDIVNIELETRLMITLFVSWLMISCGLLLGEERIGVELSTLVGKRMTLLVTCAWLCVAGYLWVNYELVEAVQAFRAGLVGGVFVFIVAVFPPSVGLSDLLFGTISDEDEEHTHTEQMIDGASGEIEDAILQIKGSATFSSTAVMIHSQYEKFLKEFIRNKIYNPPEKRLFIDKITPLGTKMKPGLYDESIVAHFESLKKQNKFNRIKVDEYRKFIDSHKGIRTLQRVIIDALFDSLRFHYNQKKVHQRTVLALFLHLERYHGGKDGAKNPDDFNVERSQFLKIAFQRPIHEGGRSMMNPKILQNLGGMLVAIYEEISEKHPSYIEFIQPTHLYRAMDKKFINDDSDDYRRVPIKSFWDNSDRLQPVSIDLVDDRRISEEFRSEYIDTYISPKSRSEFDLPQPTMI